MYNGATITVKCVDPKLTFTNGVVKVVGKFNNSLSVQPMQFALASVAK